MSDPADNIPQRPTPHAGGGGEAAPGAAPSVALGGWLARRRFERNAREATLLFISGHPRSGTNWLSAIVNLHPLAFCDGEFNFQWVRAGLDRAVARPWFGAHRDPERTVAEEGLEAMVRRTLATRAREKPEATVLADHSPLPFEVVVGGPRSRHLVITRDGRDVLVSWTFHKLRARKPGIVNPAVRAAYEAEVARLDGTEEALRAASARLLNDPEWVRFNAATWAEQVLDDDRAIEAMAPDARARVMRLRYEDLHADTEGKRAEIYSFVGLDPALAEPLSHKTKTLPGFGRDKPSGFYRKGEVQDWVNYFGPETARVFHAAAGAAMARFGYEPDGGWVAKVEHPSTARAQTAGSLTA